MIAIVSTDVRTARRRARSQYESRGTHGSRDSVDTLAGCARRVCLADFLNEPVAKDTQVTRAFDEEIRLIPEFQLSCHNPATPCSG